jgi:anti-anti-sigma factor
MDSPFSLASEAFSEGAACITLAGEWDAMNSVAIREEVARFVEKDRIALVIDLRQVTYMDSTALSALLQVQKSSEQFGWRLVLVRPEEPGVWRLFELTALDRRFVFFESKAAALAHVALAGKPVWAG